MVMDHKKMNVATLNEVTLKPACAPLEHLALLLSSLRDGQSYFKWELDLMTPYGPISGKISGTIEVKPSSLNSKESAPRIFPDNLSSSASEIRATYSRE